MSKTNIPEMLTFIFLFTFTLIIPLDAQSKAGPTSSEPINEKGYVSIGGIDQWISITGNDRDKPVILFLHGGPGSTFSPFANNIFSEWEDEFVLVQWDQRGAGRTYGKNAPEEQTEDFILENPLSISLMVNDGIEVAEYLIHHLNKSKIILFASSWGTGLGVKMAISRPDLFHAYIGHAQMVTPVNDIIDSYQHVLRLAESAGDVEGLKVLNEIGIPPYNHPKKSGQLNRIIKKYEALNSTPAPASWWDWVPEYDNPQDKKWRYEGDDYSFLSYTGFDIMGIKSMAKEINFLEDGYEFKIPIYFIQGAHDILTSKTTTRSYFDKISAPKKEYFLLPNSAHDFSEEMIKMEWKVLTEYVLPELK